MGAQCGSRGKAAYCSKHQQHEIVEVKVEKIVEEPVSSNASTVDIEEEVEEVEEVEEDRVEFNETHEAIEFDPKGLLSSREYFKAWSMIGKHIDHKCDKKIVLEFILDGYSSVLRVEAFDDEKCVSGRLFHFKSGADRVKFFALENQIKPLEYCLSNELYDQRIFKLCCMMKKSWFSDTKNLWNLAGMLYKKQHVDLKLMRKTYLCILKAMTDRFDQTAAMKEFSGWEDSKYHPTLNEAQLKAIAGGTDSKAYNEWKDEYEPKEAKEKKKSKLKQDENEVETLKCPKFSIQYEEGELPPLFDCKNTGSYFDILALKKDVITIEEAYAFVKNNIAYILNGGNGYYLTKNRDQEGTIEYKIVENLKQFGMILPINNAIELDEYAAIKVDTREDEVALMNVPLFQIIGHYRDDITYGSIDFIPYNEKTGACDTMSNTFDWNSHEIFNKFNGFVHKYDPDFVVDQSKFQNFSAHIKNIWCNSREDLNNYTMKMLAWYVQRPYQKSGVCLVLESSEGAGKNIVSGIITNHIIGKQYCLETPKMKNLTGRFNSARENKVMTVLNEAASVKKSSCEDQEELKDVITEDSCVIERKGKEPYRIKDCNNIWIFSNNSFSVKASTQLRRFVFYNLSDDRLGDKAYFEAIGNEFSKGDGGIHLYHYLMNIDLTGFHPQNDAPMTATKTELQKMAIDKPIKWLIDCINNETKNNIFQKENRDNTNIESFRSIKDMLLLYTKWAEESHDESTFTKDRFSKAVAKCLGGSIRKTENGVRERGYEICIDGLKRVIEKHTRREDLFSEE